MFTDQKEVKDVKNPDTVETIEKEEKTQETEPTTPIEVTLEKQETEKTEETVEIKKEIEPKAKTKTEVAPETVETAVEEPAKETVEAAVEEPAKETVETAVEEPAEETVAEVVETEVVETEAVETEEAETEAADEEVAQPEVVAEEVVEQPEDEPEQEPAPATAEQEKEKTEADDMMTLLDEHFSKFKKGKIVEGVVVSVDERSVLVDIGFKSESAIPIREFSSTSIPEVGTKIKVYIDSVEDGSGRLKLSKKKADFYLNLENLQKLKDNNKTVTGILRRRVKGGMIVEIENLEAFLPGSQISTKPIPNLDQFIGKEGKFKILKIDEERRNIIVSRKKVLIEEQESKLSDLRGKIQTGSELDGEVRNITDYGAFIDLGGIDGLLHITDMSWGHINHPSDMLNIGDKLKVKVLNYDDETDKVSLGLKQLVPHPWENIETKYPEGTIVSGKVVNITNYGVFVELESGVEGLVHVSEMSWTKKIKHPKQILKLGDSIKAIVLSTSKEERRISLGIKQMEANPWLTVEDRYPIGIILKGKVKTITPFGVFVEIEDEIEGLIHISDISWTKRIYHPKEVFQKGQEVEVKVLSIDKTLHRVALGVKQLTTDPWENLDEKLPINTEITAKIAKIISKGVLVDVEVDGNVVEGFAPLSHLAIPGLKKTELAFDLHEEIPLKIIELDLENRRLILSVKAYFFAKDNAELQKFIDAHEAKIAEKLEEKKAGKEQKAKPKKVDKKKTDQKNETPEEETAVETEDEKKEETIAVAETAKQELNPAAEAIEETSEVEKMELTEEPEEEADEVIKAPQKEEADEVIEAPLEEEADEVIEAPLEEEADEVVEVPQEEEIKAAEEATEEVTAEVIEQPEIDTSEIVEKADEQKEKPAKKVKNQEADSKADKTETEEEVKK